MNDLVVPTCREPTVALEPATISEIPCPFRLTDCADELLETRASSVTVADCADALLGRSKSVAARTECQRIFVDKPQWFSLLHLPDLSQRSFTKAPRFEFNAHEWCRNFPGFPQGLNPNEVEPFTWELKLPPPKEQELPQTLKLLPPEGSHEMAASPGRRSRPLLCTAAPRSSL